MIHNFAISNVQCHQLSSSDMLWEQNVLFVFYSFLFSNDLKNKMETRILIISKAFTFKERDLTIEFLYNV